MQNFEAIIIVFGVLIALVALADRIKLPNPVLLVVVGVGVSFIPNMEPIGINPEVVFLLFLPPILYDAASNTSWHDFKSEFLPISTLAILLVFFTTVAVGTACYFFVPGFTWPLAFVLGAIVSPPDAVAATTITKGLGLNKRVTTILQGESLVNDASALIAYRFAIVSLGTGSILIWQAGVIFFFVVAGGLVIGLVIGWLFIFLHKRILNNSIISTSLTLITPFVSYLVAEQFHASGVLAVVCTGLIITWRAPEIFSYQTRIRNRAVWDTVIFLLNGFIFLLIGLQLPSILSDLESYTLSELIGYGLLVSGVTIVVRIVWVFLAALPSITKMALKSGRDNKEAGDGSIWKNILIIAWTGTRGVVSLATALALPLYMRDGSFFPQRSLILFLAFAVIFMTLVIQGLTLPLLIRLLGLKENPQHKEEEWELRLQMANSTLNYIENDLTSPINEVQKKQLKKRFIEISELLSKEQKERDIDNLSKEPEINSLLTAQMDVNKFQRHLLVSIHKEGAFSQTAIRHLEQELDQEELQLNRLATKRK